MNDTTSQTPSLSLPVPAEVHLTIDQSRIQLLQRSAKLRLTLNAQVLRGLQLEENLLCLRPVSKRSVAELTRLNVLGEKILRVEDLVEADEKLERWLETVWVASVEHEKKVARGEVAWDAQTPVVEWERLEVRWE